MQRRPLHEEFDTSTESQTPPHPNGSDTDETASPGASPNGHDHGAIELEIARLNLLSDLLFELEVKEIAKRLGVSVGFLRQQRDKFAKALERDSSDASDTGMPPTPEPWPEEVSIAEVLDNLCATLRTHVILSDNAATVVTLWIAGSYVYLQFDNTGRLILTGATKGIGKTTALDFMREVCRCPMKGSSFSPALTYRLVDTLKPTLLLEESDKWIGNNPALLAVLNDGYSSSGGAPILVYSEAEKDWVPRFFSCFAPAAFAANEDLPDQLEDRSFLIELEKKPTTVKTVRLSSIKPILRELTSKLYRWADDNPKLEIPAVPEQLSDRQGQISEPLLAIAQAAGGHWPGELEAALIAMFTSKERIEALRDERTTVLADLRDIFLTEMKEDDPDVRHYKLSTKALLEKLNEREDRKWGDRNHARGLTERGLSDLLKRFKVKPDHRRYAGNQFRGYWMHHLAPKWEKYLEPYQEPVEEDTCF